MLELLPQAYLLGLIMLLAAAAVVVLKQIIQVRHDELIMAKFSGDNTTTQKPKDAAALYELASVQLRKRLYIQASDNLKQALKFAEAEKAPQDAQAVIQNGLGFTLAAQSNYPAAVRRYRATLRANPNYTVALNNLAYALEKQFKIDEAQKLYKQVLELDINNKTARRRMKLIERLNAST